MTGISQRQSGHAGANTAIGDMTRKEANPMQCIGPLIAAVELKAEIPQQDPRMSIRAHSAHNHKDGASTKNMGSQQKIEK
jgi:hypothetical protein